MREANPLYASALAYTLLIVSGVMWGMTYSLARIAALGNDAGVAHPVALSFWQALGGGVVLLIFLVVRRASVKPTVTRHSIKTMLINLRHATVIAFCGTAVPGTLYFYAAPKLPAGVLAITTALVPMLTYAMSWGLRIDRFRALRFTGVLLGFVAIVVLMAPATSLPDPSVTGWLFLPLFAAVLYAVECVYVDVCVPQRADMATLLTAGLLVAAALLAPFIFSQGWFYPITYPFDEVEVAMLAMMVVSAGAYLMFLLVIKMAGAVFASMVGYCVTLSGVFWGIIFFGEHHSSWVWTALVLMLIGMFFVTPRAHEK